jgi:hypothetical protein
VHASIQLLVLGSLLSTVACGSTPASNLFSNPEAELEEVPKGNAGTGGTGGTGSSSGGNAAAGAVSIAGQTGIGGTGNEGGAGLGGTAGDGGAGAPNQGSGGAAAGGSANGGNGGISGSAGAAVGGSPPKLELVDDLEDGNADIQMLSGRRGKWFGFHDFTPGSMELRIIDVNPARPPSTRAMYMIARDYKGWGAGIGISLNEDPKLGKLAYDASKYRGVKFWARAAVEGLEVRVQFPDSSSTLSAKLCGNECDNHFLTKRKLAKTWSEYSVSFAELGRERDIGPKVNSLNEKQVYSIEFLVAWPNPHAELWVDDVHFIE